MENGIDWERLRAPFSPDEIRWRVLRSGIKEGKPWAQIVPFVDARAIMARLDEAIGPERWATKYNQANGGILCELTIKIGEDWVTKTDGAEVVFEKQKEQDGSDRKDHMDPIKTAVSESFKRAGAAWGVGREIYQIKSAFAVFDNNGKYSAKIKDTTYRWNPPGASTPPGDRGGDAGKRTEGTQRTERPEGDFARIQKEIWNWLMELSGGEMRAAGAKLGEFTKAISGKEERYINRVKPEIMAELHKRVKAEHERERR